MDKKNRSYWFIGANNDGVGTDTETIMEYAKAKQIRMGYSKVDCPRFYDEVKEGDIFIARRNSNMNVEVLYSGIIEGEADEENQIRHCSAIDTKHSKELQDILKANTTETFGGDSTNPLGGKVKSCGILKKWNSGDLLLMKKLDEIFEGSEMNDKVNMLMECYNLVLTGAPGTGKTYQSDMIAEEIIKNNSTIKASKEYKNFVQFHPSYDYTDFMEGIRPNSDKTSEMQYTRQDGIFMKFVRKACDDVKNNYVFIIDEINRGNIPQIFGESFFAVDPDYRVDSNTVSTKDFKVKTQYNNLMDESDIFKNGFYIPSNLYIIATMNDIDRSVESLDFAFRRRFTWIEVTAADSETILENSPKLVGQNTNDLLKKMQNLNKAIVNEENKLGSEYQIGGAYFTRCKNNDYTGLWNNHINPLLKEYLRGKSNSLNILETLKKAYEA